VIRVSRILELNRLKPRIFSRRLVKMAMNAHITHKKSLMKEPNDSTLLQKRGKEREINCRKP